MAAPRSFTKKRAAEHVGLSVDTLTRAIKSGDLRTFTPEIDGRPLASELILLDDLYAWAYPGLETPSK